MPPARFGRPCIVAAFAAFAAGCGNDEAIRSYTVSRTTEPTRAIQPGDYRILGAMYPADDPTWFFKFTGPADQVAKYETDLDQLFASVKLQGGEAVPAFTLPPGWKAAGPREGMIRISEVIRPPDSTLEVTVTVAAGDLVPNVQRWADQVGMRGSQSKYTRAFDAAGGKGLRVDVFGPKNPAARGPMMGGK